MTHSRREDFGRQRGPQPQPTDEDTSLTKFYTDCEHALQMFKQLVSAMNLPKRLLVIHGVGGVGKSSLLRMFRLHCRSVHMPVALATGYEGKSAVEVLSNWADDLKADSVTLPTFAGTLKHYRATQAKVDEQARKMNEAHGKAADFWGKAASKTAETAANVVIGAAVGSIIPGMGSLTSCSIQSRN